MEMDRRGFLRMFGGTVGGGLVASATMAEAGMLSEFLSWLKRKPAWSFPRKQPTYAEIDAATMCYIVPAMPDIVFKTSPLFMKLRQAGTTTMTQALVKYRMSQVIKVA